MVLFFDNTDDVTVSFVLCLIFPWPFKFDFIPFCIVLYSYSFISPVSNFNILVLTYTSVRVLDFYRLYVLFLQRFWEHSNAFGKLSL